MFAFKVTVKPLVTSSRTMTLCLVPLIGNQTIRVRVKEYLLWRMYV